MELEGFFDVSVVLQSGVYALAKRGVVIYVGKSKSLYSRIYTHRNLARRGARGQKIPSWLPVKGFTFDEVFVFPCHVDRIDEIEAAMVNKYKPKFNMSLKNGLKVKAPIVLQIGEVAVRMNAPGPFVERRL